jgi:hypothetical protein
VLVMRRPCWAAPDEEDDGDISSSTFWTLGDPRKQSTLNPPPLQATQADDVSKAETKLPPCDTGGAAGGEEEVEVLASQAEAQFDADCEDGEPVAVLLVDQSGEL